MWKFSQNSTTVSRIDVIAEFPRKIGQNTQTYIFTRGNKIGAERIGGERQLDKEIVI